MKLYNWSIKRSKNIIIRNIQKTINVYLENKLMNNHLSFRRKMWIMLKHNFALLMLISLLIGSNIYFFNEGSISRDNEVESLYSELELISANLGITSDLLNESEATSEELLEELNMIKHSRTYMTSLVKYYADVDIPNNLNEEHLKLMFQQADLYNIPYTVYFRLIRKESNFKPYVSSHVGASGYMQLMPKTYSHYAEKLNLSQNMTPENNIKVGSFYLRKKYDEFFNKVIHKNVYAKLGFTKNVNALSEEEFELYEKECNLIKSDKSYYNNENVYIWELALSAYNAGSSKVNFKVPNIKETKNYVKFILKPYYEQ